MRSVALFLVTAACSGGPSSQCVAIVDDAMAVFQDLISAVDGLDLAESGSLEEFAVPGIDRIEARAEAVQAEADTAGCDDADLRDLLAERVVRLEARTVFGQAIIEGIRQEGLFYEQ